MSRISVGRPSYPGWSGRGAAVGAVLFCLTFIGTFATLGGPTALAAPAPSRNLIQNGCFQDPVLKSGYVTLGQGSTQIPGWTVGADSIDVAANDHWEPATGCRQSISLTGDSPGSVSQTVSTSFGDIYALHWQIAADIRCGSVVKKMLVFWEGKLVAISSFDMRGDGESYMGWASKEVNVTAASSSSVVEFADGTTGRGHCGATLDGVSLTLQSESVNGFAATNATDAYSVAERQMLAKMTGRAIVTAAGAPVCTLQPLAAEQIGDAAGLVIIWEITPSAGFLKQPASVRRADAELVERYFAGLLTTSRALYLAALKIRSGTSGRRRPGQLVGRESTERQHDGIADDLPDVTSRGLVLDDLG